jgi:aspartate-semialdehyde dehydrogenase
LPYPYAFNLFSHNTTIGPDGYNGEETKVILEMRKIMGLPDLRVGVTCVRVPVLRAHSMAMTCEFADKLSVERARELLAKARKSGEAGRAALEQSMREPLRRYLSYSYRDMSDADLKHLLGFLDSAPGKRYVSAYIASLGAGFDAMGRRCGEHLGESLRELAQAQ